MRQGLSHDPDDHHMMEVLVRALIDQDRGKEAVPIARKIVKKRPKRVPYRLLLGDALLMTGDAAGARAEWQAAYQIDPKDRQVRMRLGM
jgi:Flp pilus assembly protein TadD